MYKLDVMSETIKQNINVLKRLPKKQIWNTGRAWYIYIKPCGTPLPYTGVSRSKSTSIKK